MNKAALMRKVQELAFAKVEAELYLDVHPDSKEALEYYHKILGELELATLEYESKYGPITASAAARDRWNWVSDAWPWEKDFEEVRD